MKRKIDIHSYSKDNIWRYECSTITDKKVSVVITNFANTFTSVLEWDRFNKTNLYFKNPVNSYKLNNKNVIRLFACVDKKYKDE